MRMLLFMVFWVPNFATLCRRAVLMLWHAFLFLIGLRPVRFFSLLAPLCLVVSTACLLIIRYYGFCEWTVANS
jgi:uncharacterized membrane-anchored protein